MRIALVTDSTSDLPQEILEKYQIKSIPAIVVIGENQYRDSIDISRRDYYRQLPDLSPPPTTASPAPGTYQEVYQHLFDQGAEHILSIHAASTLSGLHDTAKLVSQNFDSRVSVVDSQQLSLGLGFQVIEAAEAIEQGADLPQVLESITTIQKRLQVHAMLNTMEQLKRSGRVSWAQAGIGTLLRLKLFIELKDGRVLRAGHSRSRKRAITGLKNLIINCGKIERFAILHTNAEEDAKLILDDLGLELAYSPMVINVTTTIGTHVGVNALGFAAVLG